MIWRVSMIGLGHKGYRWRVVLGYNNFLLAIYVVLMKPKVVDKPPCYVYVIVIYDEFYCIFENYCFLIVKKIRRKS